MIPLASVPVQFPLRSSSELSAFNPRPVARPGAFALSTSPLVYVFYIFFKSLAAYHNENAGCPIFHSLCDPLRSFTGLALRPFSFMRKIVASGSRSRSHVPPFALLYTELAGPDWERSVLVFNLHSAAIPPSGHASSRYIQPSGSLYLPKRSIVIDWTNEK